jgi:RND superfamily putative drug exporter
MVRLGRANWWFPGWLGRVVPNLGVDSDEFHERRQTAAR